MTSYGDLLDAKIHALGADDELAGEEVLVDDAAVDDLEEAVALERLEAVGVGAGEAEQDAQHAVEHGGGELAKGGALVGRGGQGLGADDHVVALVLELGQRAHIEVGVTQVDLVADDDATAGGEDAAAHGQPVVGLLGVEQAQLGVVLLQRRATSTVVSVEPFSLRMSS